MFHGLAWGYGGEGPHGLAQILADAMPSQFPTFDHARRFVGRLRNGHAWNLEVGEKLPEEVD